MNRYAPRRPRALLALMATAFAALNFAMLVALPATLEASTDEAMLASSEEPHVDSGISGLEQARAARGRRHDLVAHAAGPGARNRM